MLRTDRHGHWAIPLILLVFIIAIALVLLL